MSQTPNPADYDGKITQEQINELEEKRVKFAKAQSEGSADLDALREDYQGFAIKLGIDLSGKLMPGDANSGTIPPTVDVDKNGIRCIYKGTGKEFDNFKLEEKMRNYASGKASEWSTEYTCDTKEILQNVEVTIYEKINGFKNETDTISLKLNGPPHKDNARFWIIPEFQTDGKAGKVLEIEDPHPHNHGVKVKTTCEIGSSIVGKWFGYKGISFVRDGKRHVESWIHFPITDINNVKSEQGQWKQYFSYDIPDSKYEKATGSLITSRLDGCKKGSPPDFKFALVREIIP